MCVGSGAVGEFMPAFLDAFDGCFPEEQPCARHRVRGRGYSCLHVNE